MNWHKQHKWSGIASAVIIMIFCLSGIILNHRTAVSGQEISRSFLPGWYTFHNWNGGLLRGTLPYYDKVLIYGSNGIWVTDSSLSPVSDFNNGLPQGADRRQIRGVVNRSGNYFAVTPYSLYKLNKGRWHEITLPIEGDERLSDITLRGDSLVVVSRSNIYLSDRAGEAFKRIKLCDSPQQDGKVTLFRTVWMLHSGQLYGLTGTLIVDAVALILVVLAISGVLIWLIPKYIRLKAKGGEKAPGGVQLLRLSSKWHLKLGVVTLVFTMLIVITGWCLRPPAMIPLATHKSKPISGSQMDTDNPWQDKLRMARYDISQGDWLISTSDGFYSLPELCDTPRKLEHTPPVSVMGLNVWEADESGQWLCGSFSGMYRWDRSSERSIDYFKGTEADDTPGPPFGKYAVSGYSSELHAVCEYNDGAPGLPQPEEMNTLPMSLWGVALEAHSGRLFIGGIATYIYIFITGLIAFWCLLSGYKAKARRKN
ncbi:MAG: PepSY domain-containing protein [Muribaculaceae bacterium]|nr:PepSY domain-containing protein [Muribaculaceae bacterium]